jgi:hypothetical protein
MKSHFTPAGCAAAIAIVVFGPFIVIYPDGYAAGDEAAVAFRAKASLLPSDASLVKGKGPDDVVEIVLPGRVYDPPIKVTPVNAKRDASWKTPEQASASDFSAFRAGDPEWLRENFRSEDYPQIKRMVEDPNIRRLNRQTYRGYGEKTILARAFYKDFVLVFVQYDRDTASGVVEIYQKVKGSWKRTHALAQDETVGVVQSMFRQGEIAQARP